MKKFWPTIAVSVIFIALLAYVVFTNNKPQEQKKIQILFETDKPISSIELISDTKVELRKQNDNYILLVPEEVPSVRSKIQEVFDKAKKIEYDTLISQNETNLTQYGLDTPASTVAINVSDGIKKILHIGDKTPTQDGYYVKADDTNTIYKVDAFTVEKFNQKADVFIDKNIYGSFDENKVSKVIIEYANKKWALEKINGEWWYYEKQLKKDRINQLIDETKNISVDGLAPKDQYVSENTTPSAKITAYEADNETLEISLIKFDENTYNIIKQGVEVQYIMSSDSFEKVKNDLVKTFELSIQ